MSPEQLEFALALDALIDERIRVRRIEHPDTGGPYLWELGAVSTRADLDRLLRPVTTVATVGGWL